jgi:hypothetical protein
MRALLLCLAAPAAAMALLPASASGASNGDSLSNLPSWHREHQDGERHHRRFDNSAFLAGPWVPEGWAVYNNRSWDPDSYNDWWHDRPDRAYPRWVQHNENCTPDRMWWSGSGWHC